MSGVTYAGTALTLIGSQNNGTSVRVELWQLVAPATGANNVVVTLSAAAKAACGAISLTGVDQTNPVDASNFAASTSANPSVNVTTATNDANGAPKGLTTQSYIGVSTDPPLMLVSVDKASRTLPALLHRRAFVVNFLRSGAEDVSDLFASKADDKFGVVAWRSRLRPADE